MNILFVCTANTCRSPMAEAIARDVMPRSQIKSCGTWAFDGDPAGAHSIACMRNEGLSLDNHKSQSVTRGLIEWADITLCMTTGHRDFLINHYPKFAARIYTLCEYAGENGEIDDPYGQSMASYEQCAVTLRELIIKVNNRLSHQGASI